MNEVIIELKFIMIDKFNFDYVKNLLLEKHISLKNIYCASYVKSLELIERLNINEYSSFIDIGLKKSCLVVFNENKLLYINNIHIGGHHITKDISKVLNIDYRKAEAEKIKFSKKNKISNHKKKEDDLLKNIINSRLEEIIELLFLNCPLLKNDHLKKDLKLYFIGNGSKALNKNLLSLGAEFNFINEMSIIDEKWQDCCDSAIKFDAKIDKIQPKKTNKGIENRGFFEKLFDYFNQK